MLTQRYHIIITIAFLVFAQVAFASESTVITDLTNQIAKAKSGTEKSTLFMYRARNYKNSGQFELAGKDYDAALAYNHKGWIHLERGRFFMARKNYEQAIREAVAAEKETPTLKKESQVILARASAAFKEKLRSENPPKIMLTSTWRTTTKTTQQKVTKTKKNVRESYAAKRKKRAAKKPKRVARS